MFRRRSGKTGEALAADHSRAFFFGLVSVFLCGAGFSVIAPVVPFLVQPFTHTPAEQAMAVTLLTSVYAVCVFLAAPGLGALSDRFGRRPVLLLSLLGSATGFFVFGMGGALWVLFAGRIIEGLTGGSISTVFAYFADITPPEQRSKYFGWVGAVAGAGAALGPAMGGLLAHFGYAAPMFFGAGITLLNALYGFFFMPESLQAQHRLSAIRLVRLNPLTQLAGVFSAGRLRRLFAAAVLIWIPNGSLQAVFSQFTKDTFSWQPAAIGLMFSIIGIQDILSQGLVMPHLLKRFSDAQIARTGMIAEILAYALIAASALSGLWPLFVAGMFTFGFGDSVFGPAFNGILSGAAGAGEQGRIQGGSQSVQALARIVGPVAGGQLYVWLGHAAPALMGVILLVVALPVMAGVKAVR